MSCLSSKSFNLRAANQTWNFVLKKQLSTPASAPKSASASALESTPTFASAKTSLQYHVNRTPFRSLPVYTEFRNNRTRKLTLVRNITGDLNQLKTELEPIVGSEIKIKKLNSSIVIKGIHAKEIREFLTKKGF